MKFVVIGGDAAGMSAASRAKRNLPGMEVTVLEQGEDVSYRTNAPAVALHAGMTVEAFSQSDLAYALPFSPVWDPMLTAANQLLKRM